MYIVRFRIPASLCDRVGMVELSRSLHTSDYRIARARCLRATCWFRDTIDKLGRMTAPTRSDLERGAVAFFSNLAVQIERRDGFDLDNLVAEIDFNLSEVTYADRAIDVTIPFPDSLELIADVTNEMLLAPDMQGGISEGDLPRDR